jgi:hypothetical protein
MAASNRLRVKSQRLITPVLNDYFYFETAIIALDELCLCLFAWTWESSFLVLRLS